VGESFDRAWEIKGPGVVVGHLIKIEIFGHPNLKSAPQVFFGYWECPNAFDY
jgi:hypothetical protein